MDFYGLQIHLFMNVVGNKLSVIIKQIGPDEFHISVP